MTSPRTHRVTELLAAIAGGRAAAWHELLPIVGAELRRIAGARLGRGPRRSLGVTELVNETCIRLLQRDGVDFENRRHFYGVVAHAMQGLLVDHARRACRQKRGGGVRRITLRDEPIAPAPLTELLAVHEALARLAAIDRVQHEIVLLRYFSGLSIDEVADVLAVSPSTVDRQWRFARAWLRRELDASEIAEAGT
ncbi:MAG: sigma-70 family RNA polymerase sigma factor [Planctomycetes bacterium]|nr:sigma-70 family RNA polymerase sigma factor [Planctomycetota bacterium]